MRVDPIGFDDAVARVTAWARGSESRYVCVANVHMVMEAHDSPDFCTKINAADLVTPDGMPLVWMLRQLGHPSQQRVYGPDLMLAVLRAARDAGLPVGFLGGTPET